MNEEIWRPFIYKDQQTGYELSSRGNARDGQGKLCKFNDYQGHYTFYFKINRKRKELIIHRLVASAFVDNPDNFIQHVDGNAFNNAVDNLKWVSSASCCIPKSKEFVEASLNDANWRQIYINGELANYSVSVEGQIRNATTLKLLSPCTRDGYTTCTLTHKGKMYYKYVHRLVAEAFIPNDDVGKNVVNHRNYDGLDNRVENLEWVTVSENNKHAHLKSGRKSNQIPIIRHNLDGTTVRYDSVKQARDDFGQDICDCLAGRCEQAYGYIWTYENEHEKIEIDLDEFKPIENYPKYLISKDGRIYSSSSKKMLTPGPAGSYMKVKLGTKSHSVHRLVALHFIDKPENYDDKWIVNHKDGNKLNNGIYNLEWMSASDNSHHMYKLGGHRGARSVVQKDLEGNIVGEYPSASRAHCALGRPINDQVLNACRNPGKVAYGFKWEFKSL